jgi:hypothetical protein
MSGRYERCSHNERPSRCLYCKDAELDRLNAQALELCAELSGLRRALAEAEALFVTGCGYIDDVPDGRAQYKDRVRAFLAATAKEGER